MGTHSATKEPRSLSEALPTFRALFDAHSPFVWRVLARHGVRGSELEDACQEVFLVVHTRLASFEGRSSLRTWIYGIALRVALSFRRKSARRREDLSESPPQAEAQAEQLELAERQQALNLIERALNTLEDENCDRLQVRSRTHAVQTRFGGGFGLLSGARARP